MQDGTRPDLLATSGDFLRLWRVSDEPGSAQQGVRLEKLLNNVRADGQGAAVLLGWLAVVRLVFFSPARYEGRWHAVVLFLQPPASFAVPRS